MYKKFIEETEITKYKKKNDVLLHLFDLFLSKRKILYRHVFEWFKCLEQNNKEKANDLMIPLLEKEDLDFYYYCLNNLKEPIEKSFTVMDYELDYMFEDVITEKEYSTYGVPIEYKGINWYHAVDYEHLNEKTTKECLHDFIFECLNKDKIVCASNKHSICGNIGFIFKGEEIVYGLNDFYSTVNYKTGERNIPYFSFEENLIKNYIGEIKTSQEMLIKPKKIISIFVKTEKYNDIFSLLTPEVQSYIKENKINIIYL